MNDALEPGDRVATLTTEGEPAGSIGTVEQYHDSDDLPYALVRYDGDRRWNGKQRVRRAPRDHLMAVGCETCDHTGIVAERREGCLYRTACPDCFMIGKRWGLWTEAEEYHVRHVV